jgi:hypothetical protein
MNYRTLCGRSNFSANECSQWTITMNNQRRVCRCWFAIQSSLISLQHKILADLLNNSRADRQYVNEYCLSYIKCGAVQLSCRQNAVPSWLLLC